MKHFKKTGLPILSILLVCFYPCAFLFFQNAGEARAVDMLPFFGIFLLTAAAIFLVAAVILRNVARAAVLTDLAMLAVIHFTAICGWLKSLIPGFRDRLFLAAVLVVLVLVLIWFWKKKPNMTVVCGLIALMFGSMTVINLGLALPTMFSSVRYEREESAVTDMAFSGEKRNVYYLLFDEYGGDENLQTYFGFDNSGFYEELENRGFSVSHTSYNTESCWTDTLVPNLLNLDYVADDSMPEKVRREYLQNPAMFRLFRENGYQVNLINHRAYLRDQEATELTRGQTEDNISEYLFGNSIYCQIPVVKDRIKLWMFENYRDHYNGPLENALGVLLRCTEYKQNGPTLTVSYIQCPHAPFVYRLDGSGNPPADQWNWKKGNLYPEQLQYLNGLILEAIDNIQREDPEAVILLQSDHGARVPLHMVEQFGGPRFDAEKETPVMQSALCCAYVPGEMIDLEGDTCINATRKVLNTAFSLTLPPVPPASGYVLPEVYNAKPE